MVTLIQEEQAMGGGGGGSSPTTTAPDGAIRPTPALSIGFGKWELPVILTPWLSSEHLTGERRLHAPNRKDIFNSILKISVPNAAGIDSSFQFYLRFLSLFKYSTSCSRI